MLNRWSTIREAGSELLFIDPRFYAGNVVDFGKSRAGLQYPLPIAADVLYLRSLVATPSGGWYDVDPETFAGELGPAELAKVGDLASWLITLVAPNGDVLHKDVPLNLFTRLPSRDYTFPVYFERGTLVDPRQSYLTCTADSLDSVVCLRLIYG